MYAYALWASDHAATLTFDLFDSKNWSSYQCSEMLPSRYRVRKAKKCIFSTTDPTVTLNFDLLAFIPKCTNAESFVKTLFKILCCQRSVCTNRQTINYLVYIVSFKLGVQQKCGVETEKFGVQNWKMWSPKFRETCKRVRNAATIWFIFHDFPGSRLNSMTFQAWKIWMLNSMTFQDLYAFCTNR